MVSYAACNGASINVVPVLILIVVDNGLVPVNASKTIAAEVVLILIVVDNGLVLEGKKYAVNLPDSLNPYCSGQWSRTVELSLLGLEKMRLNPYCSGQWSRTLVTTFSWTLLSVVLILIVVDNGLVLNLIRHY